MTKLLDWDCETGTILDHFDLMLAGDCSVELSTEQAHSGTKSMKFHPTRVGADASNPPALDLVSTDVVSARWWWYIPTSIQGGVAGRHSFRITERIGDNYQAGGELDTGFGDSGTGFDWAILTDSQNGQGDITNVFDLPDAEWFEFAIVTILNTSATPHNGVLKAWINGSLVYSSTSINYRRSPFTWEYNTFLGVTNWDNATSNDYWYMDDMEVWDTDETTLFSSGGSHPPKLTLGFV